MLIRIITSVFGLFLSFSIAAQHYTQSGVIHTDVQLYTKEGVQINGNSKEMHIEYPPNENKMVINLDPHTIVTDNIDLNKQIEKSLLANFVFIAEVDGDRFDFQSKYNDTFEVEADAEINNITKKIPIVIIVNNKKTNNQNTIIIVGKGEIKLVDFGLEEFFPQLDGVLKFQFTQNMRINYR